MSLTNPFSPISSQFSWDGANISRASFGHARGSGDINSLPYHLASSVDAVEHRVGLRITMPQDTSPSTYAEAYSFSTSEPTWDSAASPAPIRPIFYDTRHVNKWREGVRSIPSVPAEPAQSGWWSPGNAGFGAMPYPTWPDLAPSSAYGERNCALPPEDAVYSNYKDEESVLYSTSPNQEYDTPDEDPFADPLIPPPPPPLSRASEMGEGYCGLPTIPEGCELIWPAPRLSSVSRAVY